MLKKILIPSDLTELSDYAYSIAHHLADKTGAGIDLLSIIPGPQGAYYSNSGALINDEGNDYSEWTSRREKVNQQLVDWARDKKHIHSILCKIGNVDEDIIAYAENNNVDLIIMGTEGVFDQRKWNKGSHTEFLTKHTDVPVLSLKCDRTNLDLKEIVLVSDFLENKEMSLQALKEIQQAFQSRLILLKIKVPKHKRTDEQIHQDMHSFARTNGLENYELAIHEDSNVEAGVGKFCAQRDIDLIVLGTHQKTGFSRLFRHNISDDMVNHLFHPILTFPIK